MWQQERHRNQVGEALTILFLDYFRREPTVRDLKLISIYGKIIPIHNYSLPQCVTAIIFATKVSWGNVASRHKRLSKHGKV